jgi:hypothetical protein
MTVVDNIKFLTTKASLFQHCQTRSGKHADCDVLVYQVLVTKDCKIRIHEYFNE